MLPIGKGKTPKKFSCYGVFFFVSNIYIIPNNFWLDNNVKMFRLNKIKV